MARRNASSLRSSSETSFQAVFPDGGSCASSGTTRAAVRRVVEIGVAQTTLRERIKVRGLDLTAEAAEVRIPHIVRQDQNDVGSSAHAEYRCSRGLCFRARIRVLHMSVNGDP